MSLVRVVIVVLAVASLTVSACGGGGGEAPSPPALPTSLDVFDAVWDDFDATYSFFVLKGIDWDDARVRFRPQLTTSSNDEQLFDVVSAMLLELEDGHVLLQSPGATSTYTGWFDQFPENFDETVVTSTYLGVNAMMSPQSNMLYGLIDSDIGYVRVQSLGGSGHGEDIDLILGQLSGIRSLIVDLRSNGGGNDQNGEAFAARFTDATRLYRRVRFRDGPNHDDFGPFLDSFISPGGAESFSGPVAVLTNRRTFSSAESLLLAFKTLPNIVSFGDFTGGGSANPAQRTLSNGWTYTVSQWIEFRADGTTFEGVGIEPDVRVDIDSVDAAALRDTIMDVAIADLRVRMAP